MKTYRYRKHIRWMKPILPGFLIALTLMVLITFPWDRMPSGFLVALSAILILEAVVIWIFLGRLAAVEVALGETGIAYRGKKRLIEIPYEEIVEIQHPSIRYLGGWMKIKSKTETIRLTVVLEGIGDFVRNLKAELDRRELSSTYRKEKLFRFYKTAEFSDQSWGRGYELFWKIALLLGLSFVIGLMLGWATVEKFGWMTPMLYAFCSLWAILIYVIAEFVLLRRLVKGADETSFQVPGRDQIAEKRVFKRALLIGSAMYLIGLIVVLSLEFGGS